MDYRRKFRCSGAFYIRGRGLLGNTHLDKKADWTNYFEKE